MSDIKVFDIKNELCKCRCCLNEEFFYWYDTKTNEHTVYCPCCGREKRAKTAEEVSYLWNGTEREILTVCQLLYFKPGKIVDLEIIDDKAHITTPIEITQNNRVQFGCYSRVLEKRFTFLYEDYQKTWRARPWWPKETEYQEQIKIDKNKIWIKAVEG